MTFTDENIETIINAYKGKYGVEITKEDRHMYVGFLQRQAAAHPERDISKEYRGSARQMKTLPYIELAVYELLLYDILTKERKVITDQHPEGIILDNDALCEIRAQTLNLIQVDAIASLVRRLQRIRRQFPEINEFPTYKEMLEELIQDIDVMNVRGKLVYEQHISLRRCRKKLAKESPSGRHPLAHVTGIMSSAYHPRKRRWP
ncbi:MAG: hypothetical protein ABIH34_01610 [Nanoarchaeota archaeon]